MNNVLQNTYPIKGFQVEVNNYKQWINFMKCGLYQVANDLQKTSAYFGDEKDFNAAVNLKIILEELHKTYKGRKVGDKYLEDDLGAMIDHADNFIYALGKLYNIED